MVVMGLGMKLGRIYVVCSTTHINTHMNGTHTYTHTLVCTHAHTCKHSPHACPSTHTCTIPAHMHRKPYRHLSNGTSAHYRDVNTNYPLN